MIFIRKLKKEILSSEDIKGGSSIAQTHNIK